MTLFLEQLREYAAHNADMRPFIYQALTQEFAFLNFLLRTGQLFKDPLAAFHREQMRNERAAIIRERAQRKAGA